MNTALPEPLSRWLFSPQPMGKKAMLIFDVSAWLVYSALIAFVLFHHEFWRDEVRVLSNVKAAQSIPDLFRLVHNECYPPLWYLILMGMYRIFHANWVLPLASWMIASASAFVFLRFSPFSIVEKILFLLGTYPLYYYAVVCRPYGLGLLLLLFYAPSSRSAFAIRCGYMASLH